MTIIWPVLFWSLDDLCRSKHTMTIYFKECFPVNFYRIRVNKYKHMRVLKNKREIQNYKKLRVIGLFCYMWVFWCNTGVFPRCHKHFTRGNAAITVWAVQGRMVMVNLEWLCAIFCFVTICYFYHILILRGGREGGGGWGLKFLEIGELCAAG